MEAKQKNTIPTILAAVGILMILFIAPVWTAEEVRQLSLGVEAPALDVNVLKGETVSMGEDAQGHVTVVEFWATWCGPCRVSIPHLTELQAKYADQGLRVIGITDEEKDVVAPFVAEMGDTMAYTVALDPGQTTMYRYMGGFGVNSIPHAFVVDTSGNIVWHGNPLDEAMEVHVVAALEGQGKKSEAGSGSKSDPQPAVRQAGSDTN